MRTQKFIGHRVIKSVTSVFGVELSGDMVVQVSCRVSLVPFGSTAPRALFTQRD